MMHTHEWQSLARRLAGAGLCSVACVGQPPSPPQGSSSTSSGTPGDATTAAVETGSTTHPLEPTTTTTTTFGDDTTQGATPGTSTGEPSTTTEPLPTTTALETTDGGSSTTGPSPICNELYGSAPEYLPCGETETSCSFSVRLDGASCGALCGMFGGVCLQSFSNGAGGCAVFGPGDASCAMVELTHQVCVCSK